MDYLAKLPFNPKPSKIMHIDLNSCFATIEQQANPSLRGKPIAVAARNADFGCIVAPSVEAKRYGIKVGTRVKEGRLLCPDLIVLSPDPEKYRFVHLKLQNLLASYTSDVTPKSIDEFVLNLEGAPVYERGLFNIGREIKQRIKWEIGDWLTVSIGIASNRLLAKTASGLHKPNGLEEINKDNFLDVFSRLELVDLCGIAQKSASRLNSVGIFNVLDFYNADAFKLRWAFGSVCGYYWYLRLRGWEVDDVEFARRSFGNSYVMPKVLTKSDDLAPTLMKLVERMSFRLRKSGYRARGVHLGILYNDHDFWHKGEMYPEILFDSREIYGKAFRLLLKRPYKKPVRKMAVSCFALVGGGATQLNLFDDVERRERLVGAMDLVNERWGEFVITPARMLLASDAAPDAIGFGQVRGLYGI